MLSEDRQAARPARPQVSPRAARTQRTDSLLLPEMKGRRRLHELHRRSPRLRDNVVIVKLLAEFGVSGDFRVAQVEIAVE